MRPVHKGSAIPSDTVSDIPAAQGSDARPSPEHRKSIIMVVIRLARGGAKKRPFYRIVVADVRSPRDGRYIEQVGTYNPRVEENSVNVKLDRVDHWLSKGAKATDTTASLIRRVRKALPAVEA